VFTGSPEIDASFEGANKNMDAFLIKPVKPEIFLGILQEKLKTK
jgi:hypothetical protein